ncbi:MAG: AMP-binding protein [Planctomycetota bacterium]|nr:AMP-binding protein [Planctomycetota bacterium]
MQQPSHNLINAIRFAATFHGEVEVVSKSVVSAATHRYRYRDAWPRVNQLAFALRELGIVSGERVASMAWNTHRHWEAWYAISGMGAVCHTVNLRLLEDQLNYILQHAGSRFLLIDPPLWEQFESVLLPLLKSEKSALEKVIVLCDAPHLPESKFAELLCCESLLSEAATELDPLGEFPWPDLDFDTPSSLCYTSGTTGQPKGILYTHGSNMLHARATMAKGALGIGCDDSVLMVVPMFHANSWGLAYSCPMAGAKLVLPGNQLDGEGLYQILADESVTFTAGVPSVWDGLLEHMTAKGVELPCLDEINMGGAPPTRQAIEGFDKLGIDVIHGWGMTEMSPVGTICRLKSYMQSWPRSEQLGQLVKQGLPLFGVEMKIVDELDEELPHDGESCGRLLVRGPWIVDRYFGESEDCLEADGWFDTGDLANIDSHGYLQVVDRVKDLVKSGGEWISSTQLEGWILEHPQVELAAVIAVVDEKWGERPLMILQTKDKLSREAVIEFLAGKAPKWWMPNRVECLSELPLTGSGKVSKVKLREMFSDCG